MLIAWRTVAVMLGLAAPYLLTGLKVREVVCYETG
jgi:hypothetical protein